MSYLLAFETQENPNLTAVEVEGKIDIQGDRPPYVVSVVNQNDRLVLENVTRLAVVDQSVTVENPHKKVQEILIVMHFSGGRYKLTARQYSVAQGTISGITSKGYPFEVFNCEYESLQIS